MRGLLGGGGHGGGGVLHLSGGGGHLRHHALDVALERVGLGAQLTGDQGGGVGLDIDRGGQIHVQVGGLVDGAQYPYRRFRLPAIGLGDDGEHLVEHEAVAGGVPARLQADPLVNLADLGDLGEIAVVEIAGEHRVQPMLLLHGGGMGHAGGRGEYRSRLGVAFHMAIEGVEQGIDLAGQDGAEIAQGSTGVVVDLQERKTAGPIKIHENPQSQRTRSKD